MILGKSIRIYLKEGTVSGIKLAELVNLTIQALSSPRSKIAELNANFQNHVNRQGVYFLIGSDDQTGKPKVYIGEAENVWERLKSHAINKDFWTEVILFTSKDENITKSHIKYLETRLVQIAKDSDRYALDNSNTPNLTLLPLPDQDAMEEFILNIKILNGVLGHKFLEKQIEQKTAIENSIINKYSSEEKIELYLNIKNINAQAIQTDEGLVVLKGSDISETESQNYGYKTLREELLQDGTVAKNDFGKLCFTRNQLFNSPSAAAAVIVGYSINGRRNWKDSDGRTLAEIEIKEIK